MDYLEQIRQHAARQGHTITGLFEAAGMSPSTWTRWVSGRFKPRLSNLERLLAVGPNPHERQRERVRRKHEESR